MVRWSAAVAGCFAVATAGVRAVQPLADPVTSDVNINCGACKGLFDELDYLISKVPDYKKIDLGSLRMDSSGKMAEKKKSYARSEVHLTELLETVCVEMKNYSGFTEDGKTIYHRYQNRPEEKGPLKLQHFGWSVDTQILGMAAGDMPETQDRLRLACDAIAATIEEELIEAYMAETEVEYKKLVCKGYCDKAKMSYMLNAWYGLDLDGKPLPQEDSEYVDGRVDYKALRIKNKRELEEKKRKEKAEKKAEKKRKRLEAKKKREEEALKADDTAANDASSEQSQSGTDAKDEL